jgi:hypothetical protein
MLKVGGVIAILLFVDFSSVSCDVQLAGNMFNTAD